MSLYKNGFVLFVIMLLSQIIFTLEYFLLLAIITWFGLTPSLPGLILIIIIILLSAPLIIGFLYGLAEIPYLLELCCELVLNAFRHAE